MCGLLFLTTPLQLQIIEFNKVAIFCVVFEQWTELQDITNCIIYIPIFVLMVYRAIDSFCIWLEFDKFVVHMPKVVFFWCKV
jgi:hypothetical protein